jgi:hypothetical protein
MRQTALTIWMELTLVLALGVRAVFKLLAGRAKEGGAWRSFLYMAGLDVDRLTRPGPSAPDAPRPSQDRVTHAP